MLIVLVWREEACTPTTIYTYNPSDPFDGIEILGVVNSDAEAMTLIDKYQPEHPDWKFHIEPVTKGIDFTRKNTFNPLRRSWEKV